MIVSEVIKRIRFLIAERDPVHSFVSDSDLIAFLNIALSNIIRDISKPQTVATFNLKEKVMEYALPEEYYNVLNVKIVDGEQLRMVEYDDIKASTEMAVGMPEYYYLREHYDIEDKKNYLVIGFCPPPDKAYKVEIVAVISPVHLKSVEEIIPLPEYCCDALIYKTIQDLFEADKMYEVATYYRTKYIEEVNKIKAFLLNRVPEYVDING